MSIKSINEQSPVGAYQAIEEFSFPLPPEMFAKVFSFGEKQDLARCAITCKQWQAIADDDIVWKVQAVVSNVQSKPENSNWKEACRQKEAQEKAIAEAALHEKRFNLAAKIAVGTILALLIIVIGALAFISLPVALATSATTTALMLAIIVMVCLRNHLN